MGALWFREARCQHIHTLFLLYFNKENGVTKKRVGESEMRVTGQISFSIPFIVLSNMVIRVLCNECTCAKMTFLSSTGLLGR